MRTPHTMTSTTRTPRRTDLEAFRGIAALVVLVHHFFLAFSPATSGYLAEYRTPDSFVGSPFFGLINGTAAVFFFFVLSGYVLTASFLRTGNLRALQSSFLKRLPRLYFPVFASCLLAYALLVSGALSCKEASQITGSSWLKNLGHGHQLDTFDARFVRVWTESLSVFFTGVNHYNSSLWTMRPEMAGSVVVMALAFFFRQLLQMRNLIYAGTIVFLTTVRLDPFLYPFILGLFIALVQAIHPNFVLSRPVSWLLVAGGVYLCGYIAPVGAYIWMQESAVDPHQIYTVGGCLLLFGVVFCERGYRYLSGSVGRFLGAQSFPTYLIHTAVIGSFSSWLLVTYAEQVALPTLLICIFAATLATILAISTVFAQIDAWWVSFLNQKF